MKEQIPVEEAIKRLGLPEGTTFEGYVVHLVESDEFLALHSDDGYQEGWGWAKTPSFAKVWESSKKAEKMARKYGKSAVVRLLFDIGEQYWVY